ncbi:type IV secretory system conjugative DNA transfer family protein [Methylobacterium sp. WSM2598]|uniref:type IV secretory system conjugative DNA transfer family protein n=1 Tax=Methylobacterium sp. WSM2598 TaxID=398261 RepID=UPI000381D7F6|nr:type IV secretory system conjugative DNA transfer family protein [Methylobacterium sp. WSM2598]
MIQLIAAGVFGWVWLTYAHAFSLFLYYHGPAAQAPALYQWGGLILAGLLIAALMLLSTIGNAGRGRGWSDGIWNSTIGRRLTGYVYRSALFASSTGVFGLPVWAVTGDYTLTAASGATAAWLLSRPIKIFLGRSTRPLRWLIANRHAGMGGSARFSGLLDEWANPWEPGQILLGRSKYDPNWMVGIHDDRHVLTMATNRAGKGRSQIVPALLTWPGSVLVIDPKGQNAAITALKRKEMGQTVRILDPLGEIKDPELKKLVARFNPLASLKLGALDYVEQVRAIAESCVVPSGDKNGAFFDNAARTLIAGVNDLVVMSANVPNDKRNLATVREMLVKLDDKLLEEMSDMGGLAASGAAGLKSGGENSTADVKFTAMTATDWLDSAGMQNALSASDFSLHDLNGGNTTIYLVLPSRYLDEHSRFLRLFVNLALKAATDGRKGKHATLFLLDEFYSLGPLTLLAKAAGLLAGYGVKLWPILQNISQVKELYPENWETFLGNAGIWTVFAVNDKSSSEYLSDRLGKRILWRKMKGPTGFEWEISGAAFLRDPQELRKEINRRSQTVAVFTESGEAFLLTRSNYDEMFNRDEYSSDPFEKGE